VLRPTNRHRFCRSGGRGRLDLDADGLVRWPGAGGSAEATPRGGRAARENDRGHDQQGGYSHLPNITLRRTRTDAVGKAI
jgi:hypothetical protein